MKRTRFTDLQRGASLYLYKSFQRMLGINAPGMGALKKSLDIKFLKLTTRAKEQGQFDVEQIDGLVPIFRACEYAPSCAQGFGPPHYAIEQFCAGGLLEREDRPALLAIAAVRGRAPAWR